MTIESKIIDILKKNNLRHLSALVTSDGLIKVSVQERKPPRVNGFDHKAYYQKNKEKIRKYQHEYYLHKRQNRGKPTGAATFKPNEDDNKVSNSLIGSAEAAQERISGVCDDFSFFDSSEVSVPREAVQEPISEEKEKVSFNSFFETTPSVVTHTQLASAMAYLYSKNGTVLRAEDLTDTAIQVMQFFGFENEVVGNHLEPDEISLMYQLEDVGLISTRIEEHNLLDGKPWRVNYFTLNAKKIRECSSKTLEDREDEVSQVYQDLPEEMWAR